MSRVKDATKSRFVRQFDDPYISTIEFHNFLKRNGCFKPEHSYFDIGCGSGDVTYYFAQHNPKSKFIGADYRRRDISEGNKEVEKRGADNIKLIYGDWFNLPKSMKGQFDGIFNIHTLCCFKDFTGATDKLIALKPRWIAFNSLFWEGYIDIFIHTRDSDHPERDTGSPDSDFNICSLITLKEHLVKNGYNDFMAERFEINKKLSKPSHGRRGTYTIETEWSKRTQFSGPIHLPWHFILAKRKDK